MVRTAHSGRRCGVGMAECPLTPKATTCLSGRMQPLWLLAQTLTPPRAAGDVVCRVGRAQAFCPEVHPALLWARPGPDPSPLSPSCPLGSSSRTLSQPCACCVAGPPCRQRGAGVKVVTWAWASGHLRGTDAVETEPREPQPCPRGRTQPRGQWTQIRDTPLGEAEGEQTEGAETRETADGRSVNAPRSWLRNTVRATDQRKRQRSNPPRRRHARQGRWRERSPGGRGGGRPQTPSSR